MPLDVSKFFEIPKNTPIKKFAAELLQRYAGRGALLAALGELAPTSGEAEDTISKLISIGKFVPGPGAAIAEAVDELEKVIREVQRDTGGRLVEDGILGGKTFKFIRDAIQKCGGDDRLDKAAKSGPALTPTPFSSTVPVMRYFISALPDTGTGSFDDSLLLLSEAFESWFKFLNVEVSQTGSEGDANLLISTDRLVGAPPSYVALTDVGPPGSFKLKMVFDITEAWDATMFQATAAHEFGHALGIRHRDVTQPRQLMNDTLDRTIVRPQRFDLEAARRIWGPRLVNGQPVAIVAPNS